MNRIETIILSPGMQGPGGYGPMVGQGMQGKQQGMPLPGMHQQGPPPPRPAPPIQGNSYNMYITGFCIGLN